MFNTKKLLSFLPADFEGTIKILSDAKTDRILGAHIMGPVSTFTITV